MEKFWKNYYFVGKKVITFENDIPEYNMKMWLKLTYGKLL